MINFGAVPASSVLPVYFDSYAGSTGASVTITGLAVTDIQIYKNGSITQRASSAGYVLIDTDGIDIDAITGIHGFTIDTGDNTDAGFYAVGSFFTVVVSAITVDSQTVNFVAATFRIVAAENTAGTPVADAVRISGDNVAADNAEAFFDGTGYAGTNNIIPTVTTVNGLAANTVNASALAADAVTEIQSGLALSTQVDSVEGLLAGGTFSLGAGGTLTLGATGATVINTGTVHTGTITGSALGLLALEASVQSVKTKTDFLPSATAGAAGGLFIAGTNAATVVTGSLTTTFTGNLTGSVASVTGAVGSVTGAVGSVTGAVGSVTGAVGSVTGLTASDVGAIKAKTDSLTFTVAGNLDCNIQYINDVALTGTGAAGNKFSV